jgi:hypothetical protein
MQDEKTKRHPQDSVGKLRILYQLNSLVWRRLPPRLRRLLLGKLEHALPKKLFRRILGVAGSGVFRQEVMDTGILFIHVPKAAGTSVTRALYGLNGVGHYRATEARDLSPDNFAQLYRFSLIRNPWERLASAYRFFLAGGTNEVPLHNNDHIISELPDTFEEFVLEWLVNQNPEKIHSVFMPQYLFIYDELGQLLVHDVYDLSAISQLEKDLELRLGRPFNIALANTTPAEKRLSDMYSDPDVRKAVESFYAKDIELFGYTAPWKTEEKEIHLSLSNKQTDSIHFGKITCNA